MTVRVVQKLGDLRGDEPASTDPVGEGAAWLRQLHRLLSQTFPYLTGPVLANSGELSQLSGVTLSTTYAFKNELPQLALPAEATAGTDDVKYMSPAKVRQQIDGRLATQVEAEAGTNTSKLVVPANVAQYVTARLASQGEAEAGTDTSKLMTPRRTLDAVRASRTAPTWSGEQALASDTTLTFTHGLGTRPRDVRVWFRCVTAEYGYAAGDYVPIHCYRDGSNNPNWTVAVGATTVQVRLRNTPNLPRMDANSLGALTLANWRVVVEVLA